MKKLTEFKCCDDPECGVNSLREVLDSLFNGNDLTDNERIEVVHCMISTVTGGRLRFAAQRVSTEEMEAALGSLGQTFH